MGSGSILCVPVNVPLLSCGAECWTGHRNAGSLDSVTVSKRAPTVLFPGIRVATPVICSPASELQFRGRHISSRITFQTSSGRQCDEG